jgi:hypothetical protein
VKLTEQSAKLDDDFVVILVQPIDFLLLGAKLVIVRRRLGWIGQSSLIKGPKLVHGHGFGITRFHFTNSTKRY